MTANVTNSGWEVCVGAGVSVGVSVGVKVAVGEGVIEGMEVSVGV